MTFGWLVICYLAAIFCKICQLRLGLVTRASDRLRWGWTDGAATVEFLGKTLNFWQDNACLTVKRKTHLLAGNLGHFWIFFGSIYFAAR